MNQRLRASLIAAGVVLAALVLNPDQEAEAQAPPATEEQAVAIERQLMCPVCPNERLDTSYNVVAQDMKRIIREQLAAGRTPDDIILYFEARYGPGVRADLEAEGFNLFLFGWVGGVLFATAGVGIWYLSTLRRRSTKPFELGTGPDSGLHPEVDPLLEDIEVDEYPKRPTS